MGFQLCTIANDSGLMARAAREAVAATRKAAGDLAQLARGSAQAARVRRTLAHPHESAACYRVGRGGVWV